MRSIEEIKQFVESQISQGMPSDSVYFMTLAEMQNMIKAIEDEVIE